MKRDWASELRAIADGRLMLNVRNGVTVSRSMLAMIADELDAERAAHAETKRELADLKDEWEAEYETRLQYQTRLRGTEVRLAEALKALEPFADEAPKWRDMLDSENLVEGWNGGPESTLTVGHLRIARRVRDGGKS